MIEFIYRKYEPGTKLYYRWSKSWWQSNSWCTWMDMTCFRSSNPGFTRVTRRKRHWLAYCPTSTRWSILVGWRYWLCWMCRLRLIPSTTTYSYSDSRFRSESATEHWTRSNHLSAVEHSPSWLTGNAHPGVRSTSEFRRARSLDRYYMSFSQRIYLGWYPRLIWGYSSTLTTLKATTIACLSMHQWHLDILWIPWKRSVTGCSLTEWSWIQIKPSTSGSEPNFSCQGSTSRIYRRCFRVCSSSSRFEILVSLSISILPCLNTLETSAAHASGSSDSCARYVDRWAIIRPTYSFTRLSYPDSTTVTLCTMVLQFGNRTGFKPPLTHLREFWHGPLNSRASPNSFVTVFIGCQSARGCGSRWSSWSGTAFLVDRRGTSRSCVCLCPPINFAVVCDHLSKACCSWYQRATPHSCKDEVLPYRDHLNGIVFRQQFESWLEMASPWCFETSSKHSCFRSSLVNSRTVLDSVPENLTKERYIKLYITLHYITLHYITLHYITLHYITLH